MMQVRFNVKLVIMAKFFRIQLTYMCAVNLKLFLIYVCILNDMDHSFCLLISNLRQIYLSRVALSLVTIHDTLESQELFDLAADALLLEVAG